MLEGLCRLTGLGGVILYRRGLYHAHSDAQLGYGLTPGHQGRSYNTRVEINEHGFRQPAFAIERPSRVYRVVCVGDSFTFGMGVQQEDSWPAHLEARLSPPPGYERVEVINAGVPGYNLHQYVRQIELKILALAPHLIIMGLVENDLEPAFYVDDGYLCVPRKSTTIVFPGKRWLQTNSYFYQALNMRYQAWMASLLHRMDAEQARDILFGDRDPDAWDEASRQLQAIHKQIVESGADLLVVSLDLSDESPLTGIVERAEIPTNDINLDGPGLRLQDGHPNARGHAHMANQIAALLQPRLNAQPD